MEKVKSVIGKLSDWVESALVTLTVLLIAIVMVTGTGLFYLGMATGVLLVAAVIANWLTGLVGLSAIWTVVFFFAILLMYKCRD